MDLMGFMQLMSSSEISIVAAFFIGLMAAISPCPLMTNITAIAYISKNLHNSKKTLITGIIYTLGRAATYLLVTIFIVYAGANLQGVSNFLQSYGDKLLGPLLIFIGLVLLEIIKFEFNQSKNLNSFMNKLGEKGYFGSFLLGVLFALAFCPFSAVLYFGMLVPLALSTNDAIFVPLAFSLGTGLPVIIFSAILSKSIKKLGQATGKLQKIEPIIRKIVGIIFILVGAYYAIIKLI